MADNKILYIIDSLGAGGAEQSLFELLPYVTKKFSVVIVCLRRSEEGLEKEVQENYDLRFIKPTSLVGRVFSLRKLIKTENPTIIHTTLFHSDISGRLASIGQSVILLGSIVSTDYDPTKFQCFNRQGKIRHKIAQVLDILTGYFTNHYHAITHTVKESAITHLGIHPEKITVIERGRAKTRLGEPSLERKLQSRKQLGLSSDTLVLVNVARQNHQKGQYYLLQAINLLASKYPNLVLLIVGAKDDFSEKLESFYKKSNLSKCVSFLGFRKDVPDILAAADIFVFPSLYEGLGGALIEAMALGLPIVASDLPVLREILEANSNALLVAPAKPKELALAIEILISNPEKACSFGKRSYEIYQSRFTLEQSAKSMVEFYQTIVARSNS